MLVCVFVCAICARDLGCSVHPVFPAPSSFSEGEIEANLGRIAPRECGRTSCSYLKMEFGCLIVIASAAKQSISPHERRMDCFAALAMTRRDHVLYTARHVELTPRLLQ